MDGITREICSTLREMRNGNLDFLEEKIFFEEEPFQTCSFSGEQLAVELRDWLEFQLKGLTTFPHLIVACGRCRVGSTALTNVFGLSKIPALFQPIKTALRYIVQGEFPTHNFRSYLQNNDVVFIKEMFGPFIEAECLFDPITALLEAGYPPNKISVIGLEREPAESLLSWREKWGEIVSPETLMKHFILSSYQTRNIQKICTKKSIRFIPFRYEWIKNKTQALYYIEYGLGLRKGLLLEELNGWSKQGNLSSKDSAITFFNEPAEFSPVNVHSNTKHFKHKSRKTDKLSDVDAETLSNYGIMAINQFFCAQQIKNVKVLSNLKITPNFIETPIEAAQF